MLKFEGALYLRWPCAVRARRTGIRGDGNWTGMFYFRPSQAHTGGAALCGLYAEQPCNLCTEALDPLLLTREPQVAQDAPELDGHSGAQRHCAQAHGEE